MTNLNIQAPSSTPSLQAREQTLQASDPSLAPDAATRNLYKVGTFQPYSTQLPLPAVEGFRPVKCLYKDGKKDGKVVPSENANSYVYIPAAIDAASITQYMPNLMPHIIAYLSEQENQLVKKLHKAKSTYISDSAVGMESLLVFLEANNASARLTKQAIEDWFEACMREGLEAAFMERKGLDIATSNEQDILRIVAIVDSYKARYASLANPKMSYPEVETKALISALEGYKTGESEVGGKVLTRLEKSMQVEADMFEAL